MALQRRIAKLKKHDSGAVPPFIYFFKDEKTEAEAIALWESANGPVGSRKSLVY